MTRISLSSFMAFSSSRTGTSCCAEPPISTTSIPVAGHCAGQHPARDKGRRPVRCSCHPQRNSTATDYWRGLAGFHLHTPAFPQFPHHDEGHILQMFDIILISRNRPDRISGNVTGRMQGLSLILQPRRQHEISVSSLSGESPGPMPSPEITGEPPYISGCTSVRGRDKGASLLSSGDTRKFSSCCGHSSVTAGVAGGDSVSAFGRAKSGSGAVS